MLWYKAWLETRWRFLIGLVLLVCSAIGTVAAYPSVARLLPNAHTIDVGGEIGRRIREAVELSHDYRGYVWAQSFRQNLAQMATLFAVLLGTGGLISHSSGGAALYTLSMPISRNRLFGIRAATGLAEFFVLAVVPSLVIPLLSPAIGERYGVGSALVHGVCLFAAGAVFFSLALLLSTMFADIWRPLLIALGVAIVLALGESVVREMSRYGIFSVMTGESYFRTGALPWVGLLVSVAASASMLYVGAMSIARHDF